MPVESNSGRGATRNSTPTRFNLKERVDDGDWLDQVEALDGLAKRRTTVTIEHPKSILTRNNSPDIGFDRSVNAFRGCEHGCIYCFARPTHAYHDLSPGVDFESRLFVKPNAAQLLHAALSRPGYECRPIAMGTNTDPYQPIEKKWRVTRGILEVLRDCGHPVGIVTKSALVMRDIDILADMAKKNLAKVCLSVTTLDPKLARVMEPRAATPSKRLEALRALSEAGIPTAVMVAPIVPAINDTEIERILDAAKAAGVEGAGYVMLRMPYEIKDLFREWLREHFPAKEKHVISLVRSLHGGKDYDAEWGKRQTGDGPYAWSIGRRFELACERLHLNEKRTRLTIAHFRRPEIKRAQLELFAA
jgi:DNA repair photolyase